MHAAPWHMLGSMLIRSSKVSIDLYSLFEGVPDCLQRLPTLVTPRLCDLLIIKIFPDLTIPLQIDKNGSTIAFFVDYELDSIHAAPPVSEMRTTIMS